MGISAIASVAVTPTITAGAYSDGDALGGRMDFENAANPHAGSGTILGLVIIDKDSENEAIDVFLFDSTFTATADNAAWPTTSPTEAFIGTNCIGVISVAAGDYRVYSGGTIAHVEVTLPFKLDSGTTLYAQAVVRGTPTFAATTDLTFRLLIAKD